MAAPALEGNVSGTMEAAGSMTTDCRLLTPDLVEALEKADAAYKATGRTGPLVLEIHYQGGDPRRAKVRSEDEVRFT
jgi:hypothetical protein